MSDIPQLELGFPFEDSLNGVRTSLQHIKNELNAIDRASVAGVKKQLSNLNTSMLQLTSVVESLSQSVGKQLSDAGKVGAEGFSKNVKAGLEKAKAVGKKAAAEIAQEVGAEIKKAAASSGPFDLGASSIREASRETLKAVKGHYDALGRYVADGAKELAVFATKAQASAFLAANKSVNPGLLLGLNPNSVAQATQKSRQAVAGHYNALGLFISDQSVKVSILAKKVNQALANSLEMRIGASDDDRSLLGKRTSSNGLWQAGLAAEAAGIREEVNKFYAEMAKAAERLALARGRIHFPLSNENSRSLQAARTSSNGLWQAGLAAEAEGVRQEVAKFYQAMGEAADRLDKAWERLLNQRHGSDLARSLQARRTTSKALWQAGLAAEADGIRQEMSEFYKRLEADSKRMDKTWERIANPSKVSDAFRSLQAPIRNETKIVAGLVNQGVDQLTAANNRYYAELERVGNLKEAIRQRLATKSVGVATSQPQRMTLDQKDAKYAEAMSALRDFYNPQSAPAPTNAMSESFSKAAAKARLLAAGIKNVGDEKDRARQKAQVLRDQMQVLKGSMHEAHSAARGLAAGFNAMWLTWGSTAPLMIGAAISTSFVQASKSGMEFYDTMNRIKVLSGETSETMSNLSQKALELGTASSHGPQKMADAMKTLSLAGLNVSQIDSAVEAVSRFATVGGTDLNESAEGLVAIATAYGYAAEDFKVVADVVAATANGSMASVESMTESFRQASVVAQQYGVSLRDTALILGLLSQIGIKGSAAGTAMRNMYTELMGTSKKARDVLKNTLGLEVWNEATSSMKSFSTIIGDMITSLSTKTSKAQQAILMALGNERGTKPMAAAISAELRKLGTVSVGASEMVDRLGLALKNLGNKSLTQKISPQLEEMKKQFAATGQVSANSMRDMQERIQAELEKPGVNAAAKAQAAQIAEDYKKSSSLATTAMKEFSKMLEESPGYTALIQFDLKQSTLEQTKQAISTLQASLIKAFESAEPALNNLVRLLKSAAGSDEFKSSVSAVVTVMAELGRVLVSNAGLIATLATAYVGLSATLSVVAGAGAWLNRVKAGWALVAIGATKASWGLSGAYTSVATTATAGATAGAALSTSMGRVAAGAGLAAAGLRGILAALGPISIALSIGAGLWIAWKNAKDAASAPTSIGNSLDLLKATNEEINQEIENINRVRKARTETHNEALAQQKAQAETAKVRKAEAAAPGFLKGAKDLHEAQEALRKHEERWGNGNKMAGAGAAARLKELNARVNTAQENLRVLNQELATVFDGYDRIVEVSKLDAKEAEEAAAARSPKPKGTEGFDPDAKTGSADRDRIVAARKARDNELAELQKHYQTQTSRLESSLSTQKSILDNSRSAMEITEGTYRANELTLQSRHESASLEQAQSYLADYTDAWARAVQDRVEAYNEFIAANQGKQGFAEALKTQTEALGQDAENLGRVFETTTEKVEADIAKTQDGIRVRSAKMASEAAGAVNKHKKALEDLARTEKLRSQDANGRANLERASIGMSERAITALQSEFEERKRIADMVRNYEDDIRESKKEEIDYINEINKLQDGGQWTDAQVEGLTQIVSKTNAASEAMGSLVDNTESMVDEAKNLTLFELETKQIAKLTEDLAGAVMTGLLEGGEQGKDALRKILVAELSKPITLVVKAIVQPIAQTLNGVSGGLSSAVGSFLGGGSFKDAAAGLSDAMTAASIGSNTALSVSGALTNFNAKVITKFGEKAATQMLGDFAAGMGSTTSTASATAAFKAGGANLGGLVVGSVMNGFTGYAISQLISGGYEVNKYMNKIGAAASMIPGVGPIAGVISGTVNRAFGRKLKDMGIEGTFGTSDGFDGNSYEFYKGGWFRSDKTKRKALDPQLEDMLEGTFNYAKIEMALLATSVGLGVDSLANFTKSIKVSFKGLSSEGASKRLEEEFQKVRESMADAVLGTKEYSQVGETSLETLERLSKALGSINPLFELLGYNMFQTSLAGASAADMLAQKFGGVDAATQALSSYYDNYYSEFERNSAALKQVQGAFERLGVSMPALTTDLTGLATNGDEARKQFRGLVDAARAAGDDDLFIGLMSLQSAFHSLTPSTQEAARSVEAVALRLANLAGPVSQAAGVSTAGSSAAAIKAASAVLDSSTFEPMAVTLAKSNLNKRTEFQNSLKSVYYGVDADVKASAASIGNAVIKGLFGHTGGMYSTYGAPDTFNTAWAITQEKAPARDLYNRNNWLIDSELSVIGEVIDAVESVGKSLGINKNLDVNAGFAVREGEGSSGWADIWMDGKKVSRISKRQGYTDNDALAFEQFVQEIKTAAINALLSAGGMTFDGVFSEAFLAAEQNYLTKVTTAWNTATAKATEDLQVLATALTPLLDEQASLGIELLRSQGKNSEADAAERAKALGEATAGLSESAADAVTAAYDYNQQIKQQIKYQEALNALSSDRAAIEVDLLRAKGLEGSAEAAQRAIDLAEATKGLGASEAAAVTAAYDYNRQLEKQVTFNQTLTDLIGQVGDQEVALLRAYGDDSRADALETQRELADMTRGLTEAQRDSITVAYNYRKELERQATTVTERRGLENQLLELADNQSEIRRRELQAIQPANRGLQTMVWRIEDLKDGISDLESSVKDFRDTAKSLRSTASDLLAGDNSPLTPAEKYAQVKGKFTTTSALAASGDKAAMEELSGLSKTFLEVSRAYNASGSAYTSDFNLVQKALADGAVSADAKADVAQMQLDATKAQTQAASDLAVALGKLTEAFQGRFGSTDVDSSGGVSLGEFKAGFKGLASDSTLTDVFNTLDTNGDDTLSLLESGNALEEASKNAYIEALREAGTALETGFTSLGTAYSTGSGDVSAALNTVASTVSSVATAISNMSVNVSVTVPSAPIVASAKGNVFTNGIVDRSTYFDLGLMGEAGPEAIMPLSRGPNGSLGVRVYAPQQNPQAGASTGSSDQALLEELRALRLEVRQLREQNNAGHSLNAQATTRSAKTLAGSVEASSSKARHAAKIDRKVSLV